MTTRTTLDVRATLFNVALGALFAAGTALLGWWTVPAIALVAGVIHASDRLIAWRCAKVALATWALLLVWDAAYGEFRAFAARLAGAMQVPNGVPLAVTLLFVTLLALSAATVGRGLRGLAGR